MFRIRFSFKFSCYIADELLDEILTKHPEMEFVQLQINYLDWESQWVQSRACYEVAAVKHGKPVIVMEPVKGGTLAHVPEEAERLFKEYDPNMSVSSWAIRFAASLDNVMVVLSGMSSVEQMEGNLSFMSEVKALTEKEKERLADSENPLDPVNRIHYLLKMFLNSHSGFTRNALQGYLNLYDLTGHNRSFRLAKNIPKRIARLNILYRDLHPDHVREPPDHMLHAKFLKIKMAHFYYCFTPPLLGGVPDIRRQRPVHDLQWNQHIGVCCLGEKVAVPLISPHMLTKEHSGYFCVFITYNPYAGQV